MMMMSTTNDISASIASFATAWYTRPPSMTPPPTAATTTTMIGGGGTLSSPIAQTGTR
jgi:hypothetical protein